MIKVENLSKSFGTKHIVQNAFYQFQDNARIALVGPNGIGKSTLLNILCGLEHPDSGHVSIPNKTVIGYLPQEPNPNPKDTVLKEAQEGAKKLTMMHNQMENYLSQLDKEYDENILKKFENLEAQYRHDGGYALESRAKGILIGLGFKHDDLEKNPKDLSGGWRMRLEFAKIFLNNPDFLILDEPTNHLDLPSLIWVEDYLKQFQGTLLFVSHDKSLLNRLATFTLNIENGKLVGYRGNFDSFLEQKDKKRELAQATQERYLKRKQEIERFIERFGAKSTKAKQAQSRVKMLIRMEEEFESQTDPDEIIKRIHFTLPLKQKSGREVLMTKNLSIGYDVNHPLFKNLNLKIVRGQKVAIVGANGIGKSTLLKTIANYQPPLSGEIHFGHQVNLAYFAQDQLDIFDPKESILTNMLINNPTLSEHTVRKALGTFLFSGDDVYKPFGVLSGGEKSRVGLCALLQHGANFLLLDEPTNHLDLSSIEILANALSEYEGTVLFVSHDRNFIDALCTHIFGMQANGTHFIMEGNTDDYQKYLDSLNST